MPLRGTGALGDDCSGVVTMNRDRVERLKSDIRLLTIMAVNPTFHELARISGFDGASDYYLEDEGIAVLLWPWCSPEAIIALEELITAAEIVFNPALPEVYYSSCGPVPDLPVLQSLAASSAPHWLPVFLRAKCIKRPDSLSKNIDKDWLSGRVAIH
jgi:hypothetical protein